MECFVYNLLDKLFLCLMTERKPNLELFFLMKKQLSTQRKRHGTKSLHKKELSFILTSKGHPKY